MIIADKHVVGVSYELRTTEAPDTIVDAAGNDKPLVFLFGAGQLIPGFEAAVKGLQKGDPFDFTLDPADAYGEYDEGKIYEVPISAFGLKNGEKRPDFFKENEWVMMQDMQGRPMEAKILSIGEEKVRMDFNPRLAGKKLNFRGSVVDVRPATPEELAHGHVHGPGGHHH